MILCNIYDVHNVYLRWKDLQSHKSPVFVQFCWRSQQKQTDALLTHILIVCTSPHSSPEIQFVLRNENLLQIFICPIIVDKRFYPAMELLYILTIELQKDLKKYYCRNCTFCDYEGLNCSRKKHHGPHCGFESF